jgi:hypothetical protein
MSDTQTMTPPPAESYAGTASEPGRRAFPLVATGFVAGLLVGLFGGVMLTAAFPHLLDPRGSAATPTTPVGRPDAPRNNPDADVPGLPISTPEAPAAGTPGEAKTPETKPAETKPAETKPAAPAGAPKSN